MSGRAFVFEPDLALKGLISALLERQGLDVTSPDELEHALALDHGQFEVFVVDLTDQDSGYEILDHLHSCCTQSLNCILLVEPGSRNEVFRRLGEDAPFQILEKPFELNEFDAAVKGYVDRRPEISVRVQCLSCEQEKAFPAPTEDGARELARGEGWRVVTFVRRDQTPSGGRTEFVTVCPECTAAVAT